MRLVGKGGGAQPKPFCERVAEKTGRVWVRVATIMKNGNEELPAWFPGAQSIMRDFREFVAMLEVDDKHPELKELGCDWTKADVNKVCSEVERL